jgi:acyl-coenzyme A thioesterase PaaI-like protein
MRRTNDNEEARMEKAIQDYYPDELSHCYGCGRNNPAGHQVKTYWAPDGKGTIAHYTPRPEHTAIPGFVYGGLIASLVDCHGTGTAAAAAYRAAGREPGTTPALRFVTGSLQVSYLAPTPLGVELELRGTPVEVKEKKVVVDITVAANGQITARGQVIAVRMPESMAPKS